MPAGSPDPLATSWAELLREKRSLAAIVRDAGRLCVQDSVDIVLDVCDELANAHANGIVHGDLGLHRVRTMWPRRPGDCVEIWALDADDTGAIDFRAAFQAPALAPEQRAGKIGDVRSDIWGVGAILHALIGGAPPMGGKRPVKDMLPGAPRALVAIVEQCLADDPDARPRSVDDVAGALASFASNSPDRFQQLARRRIASLKAKHVVTKVSAVAAPPVAAKPVVAPPVVPQPMRAAAPVVPPAPQTEPMLAALRPSYSDEELPPTQLRPTRPTFSEDALPPTRPATDAKLGEPVRQTAPETEWPQMHGVPSMSIHAAAAATAPADAPTKAQRGGTLPIAEPLPPTITAPKLDGRATAPMFSPATYPPSAAFPSAAPSMTPPPVEVRNSEPMRVSEPPMRVSEPAHALTPAPYIPPAPQAFRQRSYHPPSFGPMSIDTAADDVQVPLAGRVPSFSDLAEYREAKRASRRNAITAVIAAAAVLILGFGYGARVIKEDRANMRAAEAAAAHAPAPPPPPVVATPAPAASAASAPAPAASAPATSASTPAPSAKPAKKAAAHAAPAAHKPAPRKASEPKSDAIPKESEFQPNTAFSDAIGKKDAAPASALSDGLK
jgi:serine/threonine-protein kinase